MIREYQQSDDHVLPEIYARSFSGPPLNEKIPIQTARDRWQVFKSKRGFRCIIAYENERILGALCWDYPTIEELREERGKDLVNFVLEKLSQKYTSIIWERTLFVEPAYQDKKFSSSLIKEFLQRILKENNRTLIITKIRDDDKKMIHAAEKNGFKKGWVRKADTNGTCGTCYEYWFFLKGGVESDTKPKPCEY